MDLKIILFLLFLTSIKSEKVNVLNKTVKLKEPISFLKLTVEKVKNATLLRMHEAKEIFGEAANYNQRIHTVQKSGILNNTRFKNIKNIVQNIVLPN